MPQVQPVRTGEGLNPDRADLVFGLAVPQDNPVISARLRVIEFAEGETLWGHNPADWRPAEAAYRWLTLAAIPTATRTRRPSIPERLRLPLACRFNSVFHKFPAPGRSAARVGRPPLSP